MKWKLGVFREPFKSYKVGDDATELRPDMGPQRGKLTPKIAVRIARKDGKNGSSRGGSTRTFARQSGAIYGLGRGRRVVVKARYRTHQAVRRGGRQRVLAAHVRYLARPNATTLERGEAFFDAQEDALSAADVPTGWARDRYHWRVILSPEEGDQLALRRFVRDYAERMERELDTPLEWVAVTHHNTDQTHAHLLIRGVRSGGRDLTLPLDVVSERLREWAEELATQMLGERSEQEADAYLKRLAAARRPTGLDALLLDLATLKADAASPPDGASNEWREVQVPREWSPDLAGRHHLERRLGVLADLGLAERITPPFRRAKWRVRNDLVEQLERLADREPQQGQDVEQAVEAEPVTTSSQPSPHNPPAWRNRHNRQEEVHVRDQNLACEASSDEHGIE